MEAANITAPTRPGLTNALATQLLKYNLMESLAGVSRNPVSLEGYEEKLGDIGENIIGIRMTAPTRPDLTNARATQHKNYSQMESLAVVSSNDVTIEGLSEVTGL